LQPIAIVGASCRFPGATGLDEFWQLLREKRNAVSTVPKDRWDPDAMYDADADAPGKITTRFGAFITGIREFDYGFFGISPREAAAMDPQQRLLLQTACEAFDDAGLPMESLAGSLTGVYVGIGPGDYGRMCAHSWDEIGAHYATGNFLSTAVDRIPYFFDLRGPSMAIDTACSASLVAVHLACRALECGEAAIALAGGVNALLAPPLSISLGKAGALSPTGRCRAFDANADGYVRGEGAGLVVLKRLQDAVASGDRIYAVIRGSAINQSGRRNGLTAPGSWGEEAVMLSAWEAGGMTRSAAGYVEAHGTGTVLGDAIEANSLAKVFGSQRNGHGPCRIGSVKTNIGHLETAAGIAGLIKLMLMISHGEFVGSLYPEVPNPHVNLEKLGLTVQKNTESWPTSATSPRVGGVSSFGLGGTYAHVCVSGPDVVGESAVEEVTAPGLLIPISARHPDALRTLVRDFAPLFENPEGDNAIEICRAAARRKSHHDYRVAFAGLSSAEISLAMEWWLRSKNVEVIKAGARRKLVAVAAPYQGDHEEFLTAARDFGADPEDIKEQAAALSDGNLIPALAILSVLSQWGIEPQRVFQLDDRQQLSEPERAAAGGDQGPADRDELPSAGDDFVDLTGSDFLATLRPLSRNGRIIAGFSSSENAKLTMLRMAGELYELGYPLAWPKIYSGTVKQVDLPRYRWQQKTCWWTASEVVQSQRALKAVKRDSPPKESPPASTASQNGSLQSLLARVTGRPVQEILPDASPSELGIDSLMTLELQDELKRTFGTNLSVETLVEVESVRELEALLQKDMQNVELKAQTNAVTAPAAEKMPEASPNGSLQSLLARVTGRAVQEILLDASPSELGIDSLMTLELQDELKRTFGTQLSVDQLLEAKNVRELGALLEKEIRNSAPQVAPSTLPPSVSEPLRSTEVREASLSEYDKIAALTLRNDLDVRTREEWEHLWVNNPVYKKVRNWPIGWVVQDSGEIVGFLGTIPISYHFKGREIIASSLHAFTLDVAHRGHGLLVLNRMLEYSGAEYFVGSTANASSSKVLDRLGIARVPVGDWANSAFWITNYKGFAESFVSRKGWPGSLASFASVALKMNDKVLRRSWPRQKHRLQQQKGFDGRFDMFWQELQRAYPDRFLATRSREVLDWHFKFSLAQDKTWVVTHQIDSRVLAYAIFQRQDTPDVHLKKMRLIDYQELPGADALGSMLGWGLNECQARGVHMLEAFGFQPDKQRVIDSLAPHRRKLSSWTYFYKPSSPSLQRDLQDSRVWDPSAFDGDASL
jgi:acyl transferase domain-containing protein